MLLVRVVAVLASIGVLALSHVVGAPLVIADVVVVLLTGAAVWRPESPAGVALLLVQVLSWLTAVPLATTTSGWVVLLAAAILLFLSHTALSLSAALPPRASLPASTSWRWAGRFAAVCAVVVPVWAVAAVVRLADTPGRPVLTLAALVGITAVGATAYRLAKE